MNAEKANNWEDVVWDAWIPTSVREEIASFWSPSMRRTPGDWAKDSKHWNSPEHGSLKWMRTTDGKWVWGRYVHSWNNMGRIITLFGRVHVVSFPFPFKKRNQ